MKPKWDTRTQSLEGAFVHLECCDCVEEADIFRALAAERDKANQTIMALRERINSLTQGATVTTFDAIDLIEGIREPSDFDRAENFQELMIEAWQSLIDTGLVWKLQGSYGRTAASLIQQGICTNE